MNPWLFWMEMWMAMLPREGLSFETEEYLVRELLDDLELQGVQGIIDEAGEA